VPSVHRSAVSGTPNKKVVLFVFCFLLFWLNFATWRANELSPTRGLSRGKEIFLKDASLLIPCITSFFSVVHIKIIRKRFRYHIWFCHNKKTKNNKPHHGMCLRFSFFLLFLLFSFPKEARCESRMLDAVIFFVRPAYMLFWISLFTFTFSHTSSFSFLSGIATLAQNRLTRVQSLLSRKPAPHSSPQPKERDIKKREQRERERERERTERNLVLFLSVISFSFSLFHFSPFFPFLRLNICYCNQDLHRKMLQISSCSKNFGRKDRNIFLVFQREASM